MSKKVVKINSVLEDTLTYIEENKDHISDIIVLVETSDGVIRYFNTSSDTDFIYLASRKVREDLDYISEFLYQNEEDFYQEAE
jgi:hypothetical protein